MTLQVNDCKLFTLEGMVDGNQINDLFLNWLLLNGATTHNINDAQYEFLLARGILPSQLNDMWYEWLGLQGYAGTLNDRWHEFWCIGNGTDGPGNFPGQTLINLPLLTDRYALSASLYDATLNRNSIATVEDWEGIVRTVLPHEFRFKGARRVENKFTDTDALDTSPNWNRTDSTVTDEGNGVFRIVPRDAGDWRLLHSLVSRDAGGVSNVSWEVKSNTGTDQIFRIIVNGSTSGSNIDFTATNEWQRFENIKTGTFTNSAFGIFHSNGLPVDILVRKPQFEFIDGQSNQVASEFITPNDSASSDGKIPVRYFDYLNASTVDANGVVTEAKGADLTTLEKLMVFEEATNLVWDSFNPVTQTRTVVAGSVTVSMKGTGSIALSGAMTGTVTEGSAVTGTATAGGLTMTITGDVEIMQCLEKAYEMPWIPTPSGASATVLADDVQCPWPS